MEYIEGETLSKIIERGPLPLDKALQYAVQIVDALAAAHAKGVIHRDLKPGNVIITRNGAKVLDFGLAKLSTEKISPESAANIQTVTEPITRAGAILGTLYYMAPEQVEGKEADERSDIFSFGVVFYEMITGQRPFNGDTQAAVLAALLKDQPPPMSQRQPAVPRAIGTRGQEVPGEETRRPLALRARSEADAGADRPGRAAVEHVERQRQRSRSKRRPSGAGCGPAWPLRLCSR